MTTSNGIPRRLLGSLAVLLLPLLPPTRAATTVSLRSEPAFKAMRQCARDCLVWNGSIDLYGEFGCAWPQQNECLCRVDLAAAASKHISTCCETYCTVGPASGDISTAISLYNSYCVANGFEVTASVAVSTPAKTTPSAQTRPAATSPAADSAATGQQAAGDQSAPTGGGSESNPTSAPQSNNNNNSGGGGGGGGGGGSGLSTGAMIGIIAPVVSVVIALAGLGTKIYYNKKKVKQGKKLQDKLSETSSGHEGGPTNVVR